MQQSYFFHQHWVLNITILETEPLQSCHQKCFKRDGPAETLDDREERTSTKSFQVKKLNITTMFCCLSQSMYCVVILWFWTSRVSLKVSLSLSNSTETDEFLWKWNTVCGLFWIIDGISNAGCWSNTAPDERTEIGLQPTGKLASSWLKDVSRGGRAQHNRTDYLS